MIRIGNVAVGMRTRRARTIRNGTTAWRTDLIESPVEQAPSPQAYIVEQSPHQQLDPHFHLQDQFQVIVGGGGRIGSHEVRPYFVHYASGHTGYGPIVAGPGGLSYMTLRLNTEFGALYLPESRPRMRAVKRRNIHANIVPAPDAAGERPALAMAIPAQDNGAAAWHLRLAPMGRHRPAPAAGNRFYLVMRGGMLAQGEELAAHSCVFVSADDAQWEVQAGKQGLEALVLRFDAGSAPAA